MQLDIQDIYLTQRLIMLSKRKHISILSSRSFTHMMIDFCCAASIFSILNQNLLSTETFIQGVLIYNILAFGLQLFLGIFADKSEYSKSISYIGCVLVGMGVCIFSIYPISSMVLLGIGNACFHIGGGIVTLALNPGKAKEPGIFVAPGAIGLSTGMILGKGSNFYCREGLALLGIGLISMIRSSKDFLPYQQIKESIKKENLKKASRKLPIFLIISLFTISIIIRSFVGFLINYSRKVGIPIVLGFTFVIALGKAFGGIIADKYGWLKIGVSSLLLSLPFLLLGEMYPICGFVGIFLFNITMSIALVGMVKALPNKPGFLFGLLCMGLLIGALPTLLHMDYQGMETVLLIYLVLLSAGALGVALNSEK